jgi:lysozyme
MPVLGIDVSHHNGQVEWHAVARSDAKFAYAKATDGTDFVDPEFARNWPGMREAGLMRGAYHFGRPSADPELQATHFSSVVGAPSWGELPPVLDIEVAEGRPAEAVVDWTRAFINKAEGLFGKPFMIYTGGLWRRTLGDPQVPELGTRLLWTARYGSQPPVVPRTWTRWDFWQFTDGQNGQVTPISGVSSPCDCNRFRGEMAELEAIVAAPASPVLPTPPPPVVTGDAPPWPGRFFVWPREPAVQGEDVRAWQNRMRARQYTVTPDGIYGPESKRACLAFQRDAGIDPDGIVGRATWGATFDARVA